MRVSKKDKFEDLDSEFKDLIDSASEEEIRKKISEVAVNEHINQTAKKADVDLNEKKTIAKMAGEQYVEATKSNKLKIAYAYSILEGRGKE